MDDRTGTLIRQKTGVVTAVQSRSEWLWMLRVILEDGEANAVNYPELTGPAFPGDTVLLNTTAVHLGLGTGGVHFVCHNLSRPLPPLREGGHIIKLRYTPWQIKVLSCEEEAAGNQSVLARFSGLREMPVLIGELHSMLAPAAAVIKYYRPSCRLAYIMTDGAALPLAFSRTVAELKERRLIDTTVTCGHAFGGDLETVNLYTALVACRELAKADVAVITMGPGNTGTGTRFGFSGMEVGEHVNRVAALGGIPVVIPRLSFADRRERHRGVSHHTLTALRVAAWAAAEIPVPLLERRLFKIVWRQLLAGGLHKKHRLRPVKTPPLAQILQHLCLAPVETMGRRLHDDPAFFLAAAAGGVAALRKLKINKKREENADGNAGGKNPVQQLSLPGKNY